MRVAVEGTLKDSDLRKARHNLRRVIVAEAVDDYDIAGPRQFLERSPNVRRLVPRQNEWGDVFEHRLRIPARVRESSGRSGACESVCDRLRTFLRRRLSMNTLSASMHDPSSPLPQVAWLQRDRLPA